VNVLLRRHLVAVVAALFALAVGIALGGGPLSYVSGPETSTATDQPDQGSTDSPGADDEAEPPASSPFAEWFAAAAAARLYDKALFGHPTVIVAAPGVAPSLVDAMVGEVTAAGGGLTGVFQITEQAVDRDETSLVDDLGSQLMTQIDADAVDPSAPTYLRLGQLLSVAVATPFKSGRRADAAAQTVRAGLSSGGLLTGPGEARLAPLVLVLLPPHTELDQEAAAAERAVYLGLATGLRANAVGTVLLADSASGADGLLADLREDATLTSSISTVDSAETALGRVTAMLALIAALDGGVGTYGESVDNGAPPVS
jgi:hypothetical protein